jgi:hypothetical protein
MWLLLAERDHGPRMAREEPPPEAYGRVTNPERFRVLHGVAEELLDRLEAEYEVARAEGADVDTRLAGGAPLDRVVRLIPTGRGAPLTIGFSSFPGLSVRYGLYIVDRLPGCGCDACDEDPTRLADELTKRANFLVEGRYKEEILRGNDQMFPAQDGPCFMHHYIFGGEFDTPPGALPPGSEETGPGGPINADYIDGPVAPARQTWGPWIRRASEG